MKRLAALLICVLLASLGDGQTIIVSHRKPLGACQLPTMDHVWSAFNAVCTGSCTNGATVNSITDSGTVIGGFAMTKVATPTFVAGAVNGLPAIHYGGSNYFQSAAWEDSGFAVWTRAYIFRCNAGTSGCGSIWGSDFLSGPLNVRLTSGSPNMEALAEGQSSRVSFAIASTTAYQAWILTFVDNLAGGAMNFYRCQSGTCTLANTSTQAALRNGEDAIGIGCCGEFYSDNIVEMEIRSQLLGTDPTPNVTAFGLWAACKYGI